MEADLTVRIVLFVAMTGAGVLIMWIGRATASGKLKRNSVAGIRTASTMASEAAWTAAHTRARSATMLSGIVAITSGLIALFPLPAPALATVVLAACTIMLGTSVYSVRVGRRAAIQAHSKE